jgi:hypothetical protein
MNRLQEEKRIGAAQRTAALGEGQQQTHHEVLLKQEAPAPTKKGQNKVEELGFNTAAITMPISVYNGSFVK